MMKRKAAAVLAIVLWIFLLLWVGYTARQGGWSDHYVLLILIAVIPWAFFLTWFGLKNCSGLDITYGGIPFKYMIMLHKAALLREMGRKQESAALYQEVCPKIKDPETQKALQEEVRCLKEEWP